MTIVAPHSFADVHAQLFDVGVLPVIVLDRADDAAPLARALLAGGLPAAEVTFRTEAAFAAIRTMKTEEGLLVGAGTVLRSEQVQAATEAGAQFIVSPGWSEEVFRACHDAQVAFLPGVATATDVQRALEHGLDVLKLFPAEAIGGLTTIKALSAPFPGVRFVPTGGISELSAPNYLAHPAVLAVGGSWMVPPALIRAGNWTEITRLSAAAVAAVKKARSGR